MCPKERHIPADARPTSISLTAEERLAIQLIGMARRQKGSNRSTINDVLVDGLWELAGKEGISREQIAEILPMPAEAGVPRNKVTEMPKQAKK